MKKTFKFLAVLALGASALFLHSCSEVEDPVIPPAAIVCDMLTSSVDGEITSFTYNADGQVVSSELDGETTTYAYNVDGQLTTITEGVIVSTCTYSGGTLPSRIDVVEDGYDAGYFIMEEGTGGLTKIEEYNEEGEAQTRTDITYDADGNASSIKVEEWNETLNNWFTFADISNITNDGKSNPFFGNFAIAYANIDEPIIFGKSNLTGGDFVVTLAGQTQEFPVTATHTYNDQDLPLSATITAIGETTNYAYTYKCE